MPIILNGANQIVYTPSNEHWNRETTNAHSDDTFSIVDFNNVLKQVKFNVNPLTTTPGTVTLNVDVGDGDSTLDLSKTPYSVSTIDSNTSAASRVTYLVDTSGGTVDLTLPVPANGAFITIKDKTGSFQTNNLTVLRNGSENIEGLAASKVFATNWGAWSLFSDGTDWFII